MNINSHKQKILFVVTKSAWGGVSKYITDLISGLDKNRFEIVVAAGLTGPLKNAAEKSGARYLEIKHFKRDISFISDILSFFEVLQIILFEKPDAIHANSSKAGGIAGLAAFISRFAGLKPKMIFTAHGWAFGESRNSIELFLIRFFSRLTAIFYDKIICVSELDKNLALKFKIAPLKKIVRIHNGIGKIDFISKDEARKKLGIGADDIVVGNIAEWAKNKGVDIFLEAMVEIVNERNAKILLIGSGENPDKESLDRLAGKLKLKEKITAKDLISDAARYMKAFDVFALASRKEGLAYALLEASLAELPIVATSVGGNPEIIEGGKTGLLVPPEKENELKNAILYLIDHPSDALGMAKKAKEKVSREFGLEKMRDETYKHYSDSARSHKT